MITYTWEFPTLRVKLDDAQLQNVVYMVDWTYTGRDAANNRVYVYGQVPVSSPDPTNFTPFEQLTKEQVQGWVEAVLGAQQIAAMQASIAAQIDEAANPVDAAKLPPWQMSVG